MNLHWAGQLKVLHKVKSRKNDPGDDKQQSQDLAGHEGQIALKITRCQACLSSSVLIKLKPSRSHLVFGRRSSPCSATNRMEISCAPIRLSRRNPMTCLSLWKATTCHRSSIIRATIRHNVSSQLKVKRHGAAIQRLFDSRERDSQFAVQLILVLVCPGEHFQEPPQCSVVEVVRIKDNGITFDHAPFLNPACAHEIYGRRGHARP